MLVIVNLASRMSHPLRCAWGFFCALVIIYQVLKYYTYSTHTGTGESSIQCAIHITQGLETVLIPHARGYALLRVLEIAGESSHTHHINTTPCVADVQPTSGMLQYHSTLDMGQAFVCQVAFIHDASVTMTAAGAFHGVLYSQAVDVYA